MNSIKIVLLIITFTFLAFFFAPFDEYSESFIIGDKQLQLELMEQVDKARISYKTDEDGQIWFRPEDGEKVKNIAFQVMGRKDN